MATHGMAAPLAVTIKEGARLIGMSRTRIYELIGENRLEAVKAGRRTLLRMTSLQGTTWHHYLGRKSGGVPHRIVSKPAGRRAENDKLSWKINGVP